jgi:hypothetical protein
MQIVTYGEGGFNPDLPNDNIVSIEEVPDIVDEAEIARQSALKKLAKLGITADEIAALTN